MSTASNIFIMPFGSDLYLLITVMAGRNRAYWTLTKEFPNANDVKNCLSYGEGLPEGGIDENMEQVFESFKAARKSSWKIEELLTAAKL